MAINKVVYGNEVLLDLTSDTVTPENLLVGAKAHDKAGNVIDGECTFDSDTTDATAMAAEILIGKTAYVAGNKIEGTMPNRADASGTISSKNDEYAIQSGYHDGSGKVKIDDVEKAKIIASNIKAGVEILGIVGDYSGESVVAQSKEAVAYVNAENVVLPDAGFDYLSQVTIPKIAYTEVDNVAGGKTATIGTVKA